MSAIADMDEDSEHHDSDHSAAEQAERRTRIIDAVLKLAKEGGYDAVQLREISRLADVSLRTIYKYYGSRDNLLLQALIKWRDETSSESVVNVEGTTFVERMLSVYHHNFDTFRNSPKLFETFVRFQPELTADKLDWGRERFIEAIDRELASFDSAFAEDFKMIVGNVLYAGFHQVAHGSTSMDEAWARIDRTVRRLAAERGEA